MVKEWKWQENCYENNWSEKNEMKSDGPYIPYKVRQLVFQTVFDFLL